MPSPSGLTPGRPRDESMTPRILKAAREELAETGVVRFSIRGVARRAGVSPRSVARRWADPELLLAEVLSLRGPVDVDPVADLRSALCAQARDIAGRLGSDAFDLQLRLSADADAAPDLFATFQRTALSPSHDLLCEVLRGGQASGQVRPGDVGWLADAFSGALLMATMRQPRRRPLSHRALVRFVDEFLTWPAPRA